MNRNTIVSFAHAQFAYYNEQRVAGEYGLITGTFAQDRKPNIQFRKLVMAAIMDHAGCTLQAAATHYNTAFKLVKEATPELVSGLGREEEKKGGRKRKPHGVQHQVGVEHIDNQMGIQQFEVLQLAA